MTEPAPSDRDNTDLRAYLAERDVACPGCGYNLRGLVSNRCPECHQRVALGVALAEPKQRAFIAGLVGISLPLGFCVMLLAWVGYMIVDRGNRGGPSFDEILPVLIGGIVGGLLLGGWLALRRALLQRSTATRWALAAMVTVVAATCPLWFIFTVS